MATVTARGIAWTTTAGAKSVSSFTPTAGDLIVCVAGVAGTDTAPTISDNDSGITSWTLVDSFRSYGSAVTGGLRIYVSGQGASGSAMTVTMTPSGDTGGGLAVFSVSGMAAYGASAVRSSGGQADQAAGTPAPVLSNTPLSGNPVLIAVMTNTNGSANASPRTATTPDYSEAYDQGFNTPPSGLEVQYLNSGETSATLTTGGATPSGFAAIGIELLAPPEVPLGTAVCVSNATLALLAPTTVPLATAAATSSATLALTAQTTVPLNVASAASSATLALTAPGGGGPFSPDDVAGLTFWMEADAIGGLSDGDTVSTWQDSSSANNDLTASGAPTYQTNEYGTKPVVRYDGTDDRHVSATITLNQPMTRFSLVKWAIPWPYNDVPLDGKTAECGLYRVSTNEVHMWGGAEVSGAAVLDQTLSWHVYTEVYNGASSSLRIDGVVSGSGDAGSNNPAGLTIGGKRTAVQHAQVDVAEVLVYDSVLSSTDRENVEAYLREKWIPVPQQIAGLQGWYKADAIGLSDGANVTTWEDSHTSNHDLLSATGQTYQTNELNGLPIVRFDGVDDQMEDSFSLALGNTVLAVVRYRSGFSANETVIEGAGNNSMRLVRTGSTAMAAYAGGAGGIEATTTPEEWHVYAASLSFSATTLWIDGALGDTGAGGDANPNGITLGSEAGDTEYADVDIAEVLVYDSVLSSTDREAVEAYLRDKWIPVPQRIAGLQIWLDADAIGGLSDGDPLTTWQDSSAANHDATNVFGGTTYKTGIQNGLPVARFDGVDDVMESSSFTWNQPSTVFVVAKYGATGTYNWLLDGHTVFERSVLRDSVSTTMSLYAGSAYACSVTTTPQSWHVYTAIFDGASSSLRVDSGTAATGNPGSSTAAGLTIGAAGNITSFADADIAEIVGYDTHLSAGDAQDVVDYLTDKWFPAAAPAVVPLDPATATSTASLALKAPALVPLGSALAASSATLALRVPTHVPLGSAAAVSTATLAVSAATRVALGTASAVSSTTLALKAQTTVPLGTAAALSSATLALRAPTAIALGTAAAASSATLNLTVPVGPAVIPLQAAAASSSAALALTAPARVVAGTASAASTATLALTAPARVTLAAAASSSAALALRAPTGVPFGAAAATSSATLALTAPARVVLAAAGQSSATLALRAQTRVVLGAAAAQSAATLALSAKTTVVLGAAAGQSTVSLTVVAGPGVIPAGPAVATSSATLSLRAPTRVVLGAAAATSTAALAVSIPVEVSLDAALALSTAALDLTAERSPAPTIDMPTALTLAGRATTLALER